jgi:hypothetical protein
MAKWLFGHILAIWSYFVIWPYCHMAKWHQSWPIQVSMKQAVQMQQSGEGIKLIGASCESKNGLKPYFPLYF